MILNDFGPALKFPSRILSARELEGVCRIIGEWGSIVVVDWEEITSRMRTGEFVHC